MSLPSYPLSLQKTDQNDDPSSMSIVHNNNMQELTSYINKIKVFLESFELSGGANISQSAFNALLNASKNQVVLLAGMTNGQSIEFNGYRLTRIGVHSDMGVGSVEFQITDTDIERNTDFRKMHVNVCQFDGQEIHPLLKITLNSIIIVFADASDVASTQAEQSTDFNNKRITLF